MSKIQGLCNSFGQKVGLDCSFDFNNKLLVKAPSDLENALLDFSGANKDDDVLPNIDPCTDRTHVDLACELIRQFESIIEETQVTQTDPHLELDENLESPEADEDYATNSNSSKSIEIEEIEELPIKTRGRSASHR